jgi:hypothetical protein
MVMNAEDEGLLNRPLKIQVKLRFDHRQSSHRLLGRKRPPRPESGSDHCAERNHARQESSAGAFEGHVHYGFMQLHLLASYQPDRLAASPAWPPAEGLFLGFTCINPDPEKLLPLKSCNLGLG